MATEFNTVPALRCWSWATRLRRRQVRRGFEISARVIAMLSLSDAWGISSERPKPRESSRSRSLRSRLAEPIGQLPVASRSPNFVPKVWAVVLYDDLNENVPLPEAERDCVCSHPR
jgi:hypothetical protein